MLSGLIAMDGAAASRLYIEAQEKRALVGKISAAEFQAFLGEAEFRSTVTRGVGVIPVHGPMMPRASLFDQLFFGAVSAFGIEAELRAMAADDEVERIALDINSPGGSVQGMPELAATVREVRQVKPVVALANLDALSSAFWLAAQADEIITTTSSRVGAMGAFFQHKDISGALEKAGVKVTEFARGPRKLEFSSTSALDDEAKARLDELLDQVFTQFRDDVAEGRGMASDKVMEAFGSSRVFTAAESLKLGMIDRIVPVAEFLEQSTKPTARSRAAATARADAEARAELSTALGHLTTVLAEVK